MLQKRLGYGFSGYQAPFIPKAARSARRRGPIRENAVDKKLCAFDLLATVAGELLEGESSQNKSTVKDQHGNIQDVVMEEQDEGSLSVKAKHCDKENAHTASVSLELGLEVYDRDCNVKEIPVPHNGALSALTSEITSSHCLEKDDSLIKMGMNNGQSEECDPGHNNAFIHDVNEIVEQHDGKLATLSRDGPDVHCSEDFELFTRKSPEIASSDCSIKLSLDMDCYPNGSLSRCRDHINNKNNVKVVTRDDDENFSECTQPGAKKAARMPARIGDRRIRKLLASKYWRVASRIKDGDMSDTELRCIYRSRRTGYKRLRSQRIYPFKKRKKFYHYNSLSNSDGNTGCKGVYDSPDREIDQTVSSYSANRHGVNGSSSCVAGQSTAFASRESHVKLRIKSFRVPELFIEVPETATIGTLKRTVMEAVTALIGGGLRVGVLLQGKKIRDDNTTLGQFGICRDDKLESLGFTLEPKAVHPSTPVCSEDNSHMLSTGVHQSSCPTSSANHEGASSHDHVVTNLGNLVESDHDSAPSPAELTAEKGTVDSRALVALPDGTPQALAVAPAHQQSKRSEMAQRRIRRPFSVSEVEALVQAVEKLGTGRWRDVKLRAFDNVKHRTYVDLKDKWKTLVHTARISPQQRRGEPVPQELLDRVLSAHSYWSEQQAKQQLKQQPSDSFVLL